MRVVSVNDEAGTITVSRETAWFVGHETLCPITAREPTWRDYPRWSNDYGAPCSSKLYVNGRRIA